MWSCVPPLPPRPEFAPLSFPQNKRINKNLKIEYQHGKYQPDCLKIDSCKQLEISFCNEQCLISLPILEETIQHITMYLSIFTPSD